MANPYPARFVDDSGVERLVGEIDFSDPANEPSGPGGLFMPPHAGSPVGAVVPTAVGYLIVDSTAGALWQAVGLTNADWVNIGGKIVGLTNGIELKAGGVWAVYDRAVDDFGLQVTSAADAGTPHPVARTTFNVLDDGTALGSAKLQSGAGFWNHAAPGAQPATPVVLADVIAVLQAYGLCA